MDPRFLGNNLTTSRNTGTAGASPIADEGSYYRAHAPADGRFEKIASFAAAICLGFMTIGLWLQ